MNQQITEDDRMTTRPCSACRQLLLIRVDYQKCIGCREGTLMIRTKREGIDLEEEQDQKDWWNRFKDFDEQYQHRLSKERAAPVEAFDEKGRPKEEYLKNNPNSSQSK